MGPGWIKLYRSFDDCAFSDDPNAAHLFLYLLRRVNHVPKQWKKGITVERGQLISSQAKLAQNTGLSYGQIRAAQKRLIEYGSISALGMKNKYTLYTVTNYHDYQKNEKERERNDEPHNEPRTGSSSPQQRARKESPPKQSEPEREPSAMTKEGKKKKNKEISIEELTYIFRKKLKACGIDRSDLITYEQTYRSWIEFRQDTPVGPKSRRQTRALTPANIRADAERIAGFRGYSSKKYTPPKPRLSTSVFSALLAQAEESQNSCWYFEDRVARHTATEQRRSALFDNDYSFDAEPTPPPEGSVEAFIAEHGFGFYNEP